MRRLRALPLWLTAVVLSCCVARGEPTAVPSKETFRYPEGKHRGGELKYVNGIPVLTVQGTPEEIGEQVAVLGMRPAPRLMRFPRELAKARGAEPLWPVLALAGRAMLPRFPPHHVSIQVGSRDRWRSDPNGRGPRTSRRSRATMGRVNDGSRQRPIA